MMLPLQFIGCVLIWGSTWLAITTQLDAVPPAWSITYRFAIAALLMHFICLVARQRIKVDARAHFWLALLGTLQFGLNYLMVYEAERHVASGLVAAVFALMVITNPLMAQLLLRQRQSRLVWVGGIVAAAGIALLYLEDIASLSMTQAAQMGLLLSLGGLLAASLGNLFPAMAQLRAVPVLALTCWGMTYGALVTAIYAGFTTGAPVWTGEPLYWAGLLFLAVLGSVVAFTFYFNVIRGWGVTAAGYASVLIPIVALALSSVYESYRWSADAILGALLVAGGTALALRARARRRAK